MVVIAPRSAKLVESQGARFTLLLGYLFCLLGFLTMLFLWKEGSSYLEVGLAYAFIGIGVGCAGTPASHSLTGSVPVDRAGMASGTADLQRDLGGALMTWAWEPSWRPGTPLRWQPRSGGAPRHPDTAATQSHLQMSFAGAASVAEQYPKYADQITAAAEAAFLDGDQFGLRRRDRRDAASAPRLSSSCSQGMTRRSACSRHITRRMQGRWRQDEHPRARRGEELGGGSLRRRHALGRETTPEQPLDEESERLADEEMGRRRT